MDFPNALKMMKLGVRMTRMAWDDQDESVFLVGNIFHKKTADITEPFPIIFFSHEILADDWEVVRQKNTA